MKFGLSPTAVQEKRRIRHRTKDTLSKVFFEFVSHIKIESIASDAAYECERALQDERNETEIQNKPRGENGVESQEGKWMKVKLIPVCLYEPHRAKGIEYWLSDCNNCPDEEEAKLLEKYKN